MRGAVILVERAGAEICWLNGLSNNMRFPDPRPLNVRQHDRDNMAC